MATGGPTRTRSKRVAALGLPPGPWQRVWAGLQRYDVLGQLGLALLTALALTLVIHGWDPPFSYRIGYTPSRDIVARVPFDWQDELATEAARNRAQSQVRYVFVNDPEPLKQLRAELYTAVTKVLAAGPESTDWEQFLPSRAAGTAAISDQQRRQQFEKFAGALAGQENLEQFKKQLADAFAPFEERGLLNRLPQTLQRGNQEEILVHPVGQPAVVGRVRVSEVKILALQQSLLANLAPPVASHVFDWLQPRLKPTLTLKDKAQAQQALEDAAKSVEEVVVKYEPGQPLAEAGKPLNSENIKMLRAEYYAALAMRTPAQKFTRALTVAGMIFALLVVCGVYMQYRRRGPLTSWRRLSVILALAVLTVALSRWASAEPWKAEIIPLMLFGMTVAIAYHQELALLLCGVLSLVLVLAIGHGLHEFLLLLGITTAANLNMGRIRSRSKLVYVGLFAGAVAMLLEIGLGLVDNQPLMRLLPEAARSALWVLLAGFLMTGLLPFVERTFGVLTDLSLLELGDVTHPLLQELARRAPSTYNHSMTVGVIAEAAADSIGARGLLCRVGAYFHDIGKMLKPGYFVENQNPEENRHESLVPAMSSLVIVAHIKDGAGLARQYHLPEPIIDLIEQHHGTTRVGFFYERASEQQQQSDPNGGEVDERTYMYPGPKPQTKEAAVLMLADAVESASRTLVDPAPKRIESLVRDLAERRLHGGQFDESGLTLRELRTIERSMVKLLTSIYHGRLKYPDQRTA
jgi:putative nucleotidyltransferase with HDIG domain